MRGSSWAKVLHVHPQMQKEHTIQNMAAYSNKIFCQTLLNSLRGIYEVSRTGRERPRSWKIANKRPGVGRQALDNGKQSSALKENLCAKS